MIIAVIVIGLLSALFILSCFGAGFNGNKQDGYVVGLCGVIGAISLISLLVIKGC